MLKPLPKLSALAPAKTPKETFADLIESGIIARNLDRTHFDEKWCVALVNKLTPISCVFVSVVLRLVVDLQL